MVEGHENPDFLHHLPNLMFLLRSDTLARHLAVMFRIQGKVNRGKGSGTQTLRCHDIIADALK